MQGLEAPVGAAVVLLIVAVATVYRVVRRRKKRKEREMAQGLQVWDSSGNLVLDSAWRMGRVAGFQLVQGAFTITVPKTASESIFFCVYSAAGGVRVDSISVSGNQIVGNNYGAFYILYGVY